METQIYAQTHFILRHDTASAWNAENPVLALGEPGFVSDFSDGAHMLKIGDGKSPWTELPFVAGK